MEFQSCTRCIMDNKNDPYIWFDEQGFCSYCTEALKYKDLIYFPNEEGAKKLATLIQKIKKSGEGKKYDCMMGLSGGLDSSYLALLGKQWGLRILAVHVDDGFDTEVAKSNIGKLCQACDLELITIKPDEEQFNGLTKAFLLSGSANPDTPQDNVLFASLYSYAKKYKIRYFLSGGNFALESILQKTSKTNTFDTKRIKYIQKKYGDTPITKLNIISNYRRVVDKYIYRIRTIRPLNLIDYNKARAIEELNRYCDFQYYEAKHCENYLTKVIQLYWLPIKFKLDKRKSHLSSLIISNQMDRDRAIEEMSRLPYDLPNMERDVNYVLSKLKLDRVQFDEILKEGGTLMSDEKTSIGYRIASRYFRSFLIKYKG